MQGSIRQRKGETGHGRAAGLGWVMVFPIVVVSGGPGPGHGECPPKCRRANEAVVIHGAVLYGVCDLDPALELELNYWLKKGVASLYRVDYPSFSRSFQRRLGCKN